jgi:ParB family transcriptional regulator, chromosome partitioning protein
MRTVVSVDPSRCRMWSLHDRCTKQITEASCAVEIQSFKARGQMIPVLGRPLHGDSQHDIELIYGARRLFVARFVNQPLLVDLRELSDRQAIIALDIENRQRKDLSPYERGLSYARWLRAGHFESQEEMARALNVSPAHVSRLLKLARLPSVVVSAFGGDAHIRETWGLEVMDVLDDQDRRASILLTARRISATQPRPTASVVLSRLLAAGTRERGLKNKARDIVIKDDGGAPLFRIRRHSGSMTYLLPSAKMLPEHMQRIEHEVARILMTSRAPSRTKRHNQLIVNHNNHECVASRGTVRVAKPISGEYPQP